MVQLMLARSASDRLMSLWHSSPLSKDLTPQGPSASNAPPGLANLGNTCFMNAVLQCLLNTPDSLAEACLALEEQSFDAEETPSSVGAKVLVRGFASLVREYKINEGKALLKSNSALKNMKVAIATLDQQYAGCEQQDAYEFLGCLLDGLEEKFKVLLQKPPREDGVVREICGVASHTTRTCQCCSTAFQVDKVTDTAIRLPLISALAQADEELRQQEEENPIALEDLLKSVQTPEEIDGYDCDACRAASIKEEREHVRSQVTQQSGIISRTGDVLAIVLYRFCHTFDAAGRFQPSKVKRRVTFPTKALSLDTGDYDLFGVVSHIGSSLASGHYVAAVQREGEWYSCDDERVSPVTQKAVYDGRPISGIQPGSDPYILFYQRRQEAPQVSECQGAPETEELSATVSAETEAASELQTEVAEAFQSVPEAEQVTEDSEGTPEATFPELSANEWVVISTEAEVNAASSTSPESSNLNINNMTIEVDEVEGAANVTDWLELASGSVSCCSQEAKRTSEDGSLLTAPVAPKSETRCLEAIPASSNCAGIMMNLRNLLSATSLSQQSVEPAPKQLLHNAWHYAIM
mmetsp:Transcript_96377/g.171296  ORF Transcript_96377/g.171296 Transcript_96377/m.171296 type:complete len:580 (-) Transcript_96377:218-1957(-)